MSNIGAKKQLHGRKKTTSFMVVLISTLSVPKRNAGPNKRTGWKIS